MNLLRPRLSGFALATILLLAASSPPAEPPPVYLDTWGSQGPAGGQFQGPAGLAFGPERNLYVADRGNERIHKLDRNGNFLRTWGWGVYDGTPEPQWCTSGCQAGIAGSGPSQFDEPFNVAVDSQEEVYVADRMNHRIQKFMKNGTGLRRWGSYGTGESNLNMPSGVAVGPAGKVFVADTANNRITKYEPNGTFLRMWGWGVKNGTAEFQICTSGCTSGIEGSGDGQFHYPQGVAVDAAGNVYVAEFSNERIQRFRSDGSFVSKWGSYGTDDGQSVQLRSVAVDARGDVYVPDWGGNRIQKFDSLGNFLCKWGTFGTADGEFKWPYGMTLDTSGDLYVTDAGNNRIQKFGGPWLDLYVGDPEPVSGR